MRSKLKDIINRDKVIHEISPDAMLLEAAKKMANNRVGSLLVKDGDKICSIITERDMLFKVLAKNLDIEKTKVSAVMSESLLVVSTETTAAEALMIMTEKRIRHLPVYDGEIFIGLLSIGDMAKWASTRYQEKQHEVESLVHYISQ
ncbi:MAG: CBS domain-containing protein [Francisellaceae bacterium]